MLVEIIQAHENQFPMISHMWYTDELRGMDNKMMVRRTRGRAWEGGTEDFLIKGIKTRR